GTPVPQTDYMLSVSGTTTTTQTATSESNSLSLHDDLPLAVQGTGSSADYRAMSEDADGNPLTQTDYMLSVSGTTTTTLTASYVSNSYNLADQLVLAEHGSRRHADKKATRQGARGKPLAPND